MKKRLRYLVALGCILISIFMLCSGAFAAEKDTLLVVDGKSYDASVSHDYSNGGTEGWKYDAGSITQELTLYNYTGGTIYLPLTTEICFLGENTIMGMSGNPAISGEEAIYFRGRLNEGANSNHALLKIFGGDAAPAVSASSVLIFGGTVEFYGGAHSPAVASSVYQEGGYAVFQGGSDMPAFNARVDGTYSFGFSESSIACFAGADKNTLSALTSGDAYNGENFVTTQPKMFKVTFDAGEGKANGRSVFEHMQEANTWLTLSDISVWHPSASFVGWEQNGELCESWSIPVVESLTLTARWEPAPYKNYLKVKIWNGGSITGNPDGIFELPETGTVTLPAPEIDDEAFRFASWTLLDEEYNHIGGFPAGEIPVEALRDGKYLQCNVIRKANYGCRLWLCGNTQALFLDGQWFFDQSRDGNTVLLQEWYSMENPAGLILDHWNTKADGTGTKYQIGDIYTFPEGVDTTILYAQWKPALTHTTNQSPETLPSWSEELNEYLAVSDNWYQGFVGWRNAECTEFWLPGEVCTAPAGTTLYAVAGLNDSRKATIALYANCENATPSFVAVTELRSGEGDVQDVTVSSGGVRMSRQGYTHIGWNTKADGSGTFYDLNTSFLVGEYHANISDWNSRWVYNEEALASCPKALYAQWESKDRIPVPKDMLEQENAQIYMALYEDGQMVDIVAVDANSGWVSLYDVGESNITYGFFCLSNNGTMVPLTTAETGELF